MPSGGLAEEGEEGCPPVRSLLLDDGTACPLSSLSVTFQACAPPPVYSSVSFVSCLSSCDGAGAVVVYRVSKAKHSNYHDAISSSSPPGCWISTHNTMLTHSPTSH